MKGGKRKGAGRPRGIRKHKICIKIQEETFFFLQTVGNKSAYIDHLIRKDLSQKIYYLGLKDEPE